MLPIRFQQQASPVSVPQPIGHGGNRHSGLNRKRSECPSQIVRADGRVDYLGGGALQQLGDLRLQGWENWASLTL